MSQNLALGLASAGQNFMNSYNSTKRGLAEARDREEERAWRNEQRAQQRADWDQKSQLRTSLAAASAPASVDHGHVVTDVAGSEAFTKDADAAAAMADMVSGQGPSLASATRVQGKTYTDRAQARAAEAEYNSPVSKLDRMGDAAMSIDPSTGISLKNSATTQRQKKIEMDKAMKAEADETFNRVLLERLTASPNWWEGAAEVLSNSPGAGLNGVTVKPVPSADGKNVDMVAVSPDGKERVVKSWPTDAKGQQAFIQNAMRADAGTKLKWLSEQVTRDYEQSKQQEKHQLTLAEIGARGAEDRRTVGYRASLDNKSGAKPLSSMDRMLIDGRRSEARKSMEALQDQISDPILQAQAQRPGPQQDRMRVLQERLTAAEADYQRWDGAMNELAGSALERTGLGAARPAGAQQNPAPVNSEPARVSNKAERDKLPKGARYIGPDGQTYVKQ